MAQANVDLISRPCSDIPEFERFRQQDYRRQALMDQTGGGDAFVEAAAPVIRKSVIQALPYASPSSKYVHELRRAGMPDDMLDRSLARAWLDASDHFQVPRPRRRDFLRGSVALLLYSTLVTIAALFGLVRYLRHAHPDLASIILGLPPLLAILGVPMVILLFLALRKMVHRH
jgi:hypothetical protein